MSDAVGEDRSSYQAVGPWSQDFGMCKAAEGTTYTDPTFKANWAALGKAGIPRVAYHFFHPALSPTAQAQFFAAVVRAQGLEEEDGAALDCELTLNSSAVEVLGTKSAATPRMVLSPMTKGIFGPACTHGALVAPADGAQSWCSHCNQYCGGSNSVGQEIVCAGCAQARAAFAAEAFSLQSLVEEFIAEADKLLGVRPRLLYTYADMAASSFDDAFAEANPNLWVAEYGVSAPSLGPWKTWRFWQHESGGGPGGGDADFYNGGKDALDEWFASFRVTPKPPPLPAPVVPAWQHAIIARLPELRSGSRDSGGQTEWVRQAQLLVDVVGVAPVTADGDYGPATEAAVKKTQESRSVPQSGVTDPETWQCLVAGSPSGVLPSSVARGALDEAGKGTYWVHRVQVYCEAHNVPTSVDGDYGPGTEAAVKAVQKAYGEPETGVVDETTWSLLIAHAKP